MYNTAKYIKLIDCVYSYINRANLTAAHEERLWAIAYEGVEMLNLDIFNSIETRKLNLNPNKTLTLPQNYLKYVKIGVLNDYGEVATLRENSDMTLYAGLSNDRLSNINDSGLGTDFSVLRNYYLNYWDGGNCYNFLGTRSGTNSAGDFKIDEKNGIILFNSAFAYDYVILEYIASPSQDEDVYVPIEAKQTIVSYLGWADIEYLPQSRRSNTMEKRIREKKFWNERRLAKMRINPIRLWEANDIVRLSGTLAIKG